MIHTLDPTLDEKAALRLRLNDLGDARGFRCPGFTYFLSVIVAPNQTPRNLNSLSPKKSAEADKLIGWDMIIIQRNSAEPSKLSKM
jgi:hypothetical protein